MDISFSPFSEYCTRCRSEILHLHTRSNNPRQQLAGVGKCSTRGLDGAIFSRNYSEPEDLGRIPCLKDY